MLGRMSARAAAASSTNRQNAAPRDRASSPSAPVPAKRSMTRAPASENLSMPCARMLNRDSRTRSDVGRTVSSFGAAMARPRKRPATILMACLAPAPSRALPARALRRPARRARARLAMLDADLLGQHAPLHRLDRARLQVEQLERPVGDADQAVHRRGRGARGCGAPRGSCPRAGRSVSHALAPCTLSTSASIGP